MNSCPLGCSHPSIRPVFHGDANRIKKCERCSIVFVYPRQARAEIENQYSKDYFENKYRRLIDSGYVSPEFSKVKMMDCLRHAASACRSVNGTPGVILDVGCGTGRFLELAQKEGWETQGLELFSGIAEDTARRLGIKVQVASIQEADLPDESFDIVTLFDVIEHLEEPIRALQVCNRILKRGGVIVLTTPNFKGLGRRLVGETAFAIWPDEHLVYFDPSTLAKVLEMAEFRRIEVKSREIYAENAGMLLSRWRGRPEKVSSMPTGTEASVLRVKSLVRGSRFLRTARSLANNFFAHVRWGDELVAFAVRASE